MSATEDRELSEATYQNIVKAMFDWDGGKPAPGFSHWTPDGVFEIVVAQRTFPPVLNVLFNGEWIGSGVGHDKTCAMIAEGRYDKHFGFVARDRGLPADLRLWNNLR